MKLISMTDFCLQLLNKDATFNEVEMLTKISNYAKFIKQPLTLGMFVPCDDDGKPIFDNCKHNNYCVDFCQGRCNENFIEAQSKVVFKGFRLKRKAVFSVHIENEENTMYFTDINMIFTGTKKVKTVEDLIPYNLDLAVSF